MTTKGKGLTAEEFVSRFPPERRAKIAARAQELIAEELTLRDLRKAHDLTQSQIATMLGIGQDHVSRIEQRTDMLLSTLASYVRAMGGSLKLVADFPGRKQVALTGLADVFDVPPVPPKKKRRKKNTAGAAR